MVEAIRESLCTKAALKPERYSCGIGNRFLLSRQFITEKCVWLDDLPSKITLIENPYLDRDEYPSVNDHERSKQSIAIDENPLREMKKMRRQLGGVAGRLYQLEDEIEKQNSREKLVFSAIFGAAAAVLLFLLRR
ncbi:hypothetical protein KIN20_011632 [Parelaphostrongylus tenuis]|uniref:Mitochondrial fission factor n=1 Tax=Parelaphostrongylus tenuis TaxID=148309 RepID=A0AAD5QM80_PARTN|nr:hypothetical protein KIN20_011632 [Parelaphostrongylus tenuis]